MMMIGQRMQQNDRQRRLRKSQMYKQMLDKQILMNEQYHKDSFLRSRFRDTEDLNPHNPLPSVPQKAAPHLQNSFIHEVEVKESRQKNRFLPLIRDKNTYYRGSSKYIKIDGIQNPVRQVRHVVTEQIQQEQNQQNDEYNSTCERIIRQLQSIKSKPVKFRSRRKLYDMTDMTPHRQVHERTRFSEHLAPEYSQQKSLPSMSYQSTKPISNPENRYSQFISTDLENPQLQPNQFDQSSVRKHEYKQKSFGPSLKNQIGLKNQIDVKKVSKLSVLLPTQQNKNSSFNSLSAKEDFINQDPIEKTKMESIDNRPESNFKSRDNAPSKLSVFSSKPKDSNEQNKIENGEPTKIINEKERLRRQNFLHLLRKVKNRGESLCLKMSKYPIDKPCENT